MATLQGIKAKIRKLINSANAVTGNSDSDLTTAVNVLVDGYGVGDSTGYYRYLTFMDTDYETIAGNVAIAPKYSCNLPIGPTLTKESTVDTVYTHTGWSLIPDGELNTSFGINITENLTLYPVFEPSVRYYNIRFYDGNKLLYTDKVPYKGYSEYTYKKIGARFQGWSPEPVNIMGDMDCYGTWEFASFATDSWLKIVESSRDGSAADLYSLGDEKKITITYSDGSYEDTGVQIVRLNAKTDDVDIMGSKEFVLDDLSDLSTARYPGITVLISIPLSRSSMHFKTTIDSYGNYTRRGFPDSDVYKYLHEEILPGLPSELINLIPYTRKRYSYYIGDGKTAWSAMDCKLWPPSSTQVNANGGLGHEDYHDEYEYFSYTTANSLPGSPTDDPLESRVRKTLDGYAVPWWTLTVEDGYNVHIVEADGSISEARVNTDKAYVIFGFGL